MYLLPTYIVNASMSTAHHNICQHLHIQGIPARLYLCHLLSVRLLDGCSMHAMGLHNSHLQCILTHILYHAPGPSGSMTPPASSLPAPSTPRTQPQPSTSAAAALRNQPATTSQVALIFFLLMYAYTVCCDAVRGTTDSLFGHIEPTLSVYSVPHTVMQSASVPFQQSSVQPISPIGI